MQRTRRFNLMFMCLFVLAFLVSDSGPSWAQNGKDTPIVPTPDSHTATLSEPMAVRDRPLELSGCAVVDGGLLMVEDELVGSVLLVEDSTATPLVVSTVKLERKKKDRKPFAAADKLFPLQDFEDIASDRDELVFLVGSHQGKNGERRPDREFLLQATWDKKGKELKVRGENYHVLDQIAQSLDTLKAPVGLSKESVVDTLNIEGLAYHDSQLYIGLRGPKTPEGHAILFTVDPSEAFGGSGKPNWTPQRLDLQGAGIRGMDWDPKRNVLLILSGPGHDSHGVPFTLWQCNPDGTGLTPIVEFPPAIAKKLPEGICRLPEDGGGDLLVVLDGEGGGHGAEVVHIDW